MRRGWLAGVAAVAVTGIAGSAVRAETVKLQDAVRLGEHWFGPEVSMKDLEGRVVLIEDWGYR